MAYRDVDVSDQNFLPLVNQMRQVLASNADFAHASNAGKQEYEQVAHNMQRAAKGYLEQFLKTDADRVQLTESGLVLR